MTYSRHCYDQDFKKNAVRLSFNSSKPVKTITSELSVPERALYRWRKLYTAHGKQTPFASLESKNHALKRENAELALERDMLVVGESWPDSRTSIDMPRRSQFINSDKN